MDIKNYVHSQIWESPFKTKQSKYLISRLFNNEIARTLNYIGQCGDFLLGFYNATITLYCGHNP